MHVSDGGGFSSQEINLEMTRISLIRGTLQDALGRVETGAKLAAIPTMSFGGASTATELEGHAGKAHDRIVSSLTKTIDGLSAYEKNLQHFVDDSTDTDETQRVAIVKITEATSCVAPTTFRADDQCAAPPGNEDDS